MRVVIGGSAELGALAARVANETLLSLRRPVVGFATGSSPLPLYREWAQDVAVRQRLHDARGFALDEYVGLEPGHPQSYRTVITREVELPLGMAEGAVEVPDGGADDLVAAAERFETSIADAGGVDLQVLGIGSNGHIGFNEPSSSLLSRTREVVLAESTRRDNARYFADQAVPRTALTQGLGTILESGHIVVIASGRTKATAVRAMVEGPVSAACPASVLQFHHKVDVVLDDDAAALLAHRDYYRAGNGSADAYANSLDSW